MSRVKEIADGVSDVVAIVALVALAVKTQADATTVVLAISGLAGYKMRGRR